ncbi:MAG: peptidase C2 calpain [Brasilonema octagenarum HA4186-MV1]|jgi:hypothetical protein|nr:peptidase C2 calpain [Brasilonema octagenarum HA4186-MV1]
MSFDFAGNTIGTDHGLNITSNTLISRDTVGLLDTNDVYGLSFSGRSSSHMLLNSLSTDVELPLTQDSYSNGLNNSGDIFGVSYVNGTQTESINTTLNTDIHFVQVDEFGNVSTSSNSSVSTQGADWFSQNLRDSQIITTARNLAADGNLSRNDMISIFRNAEDGSIIDGNELTDLRTIVSNGNRFNMQDSVRVLSNKVVNGDVANPKYQGTSLGNLSAGSSGDQMEKLINKWFLGSDHPTIPSNYKYQLASGSLFQNGVSYKDVNQGALSDCYFFAGLGEVAFRSPTTIQNMFTDNGDNTYTVRFYKNGVADYLTVDRYLPTDLSGNFVYAKQGGSNGGNYKNSSNELWVALAEKAYAQLNESGWIGQDGTNSYKGIEYGADNYVVNHITGRNSFSSSLDFNSMVSAFNSGSLMGVSSKVGGVASNIVPNHVYVVVDYNSSTQQFTLYNPWGVNGGTYEGYDKPGTVKLSFAQLNASFSSWSHTTS